MAIDNGKLIIDIDGNTKELEKSLNRLDEVGSSALTALAAGIAALGTGFVAASAHSLKLASDLQEVQNVVDVTFGDGAAQIQAFADSAEEAFGLSELQAKKYSSTLGAMMKSMGLTSGEVLDMSQNLTGLAGDFASFYNLDHQTAFDKIRSGLSGETEPLMQLGINMQVASLEAYALSKGIQTAFKDMSAAEKAILRYNYLLEVSADAQGDFARTADGYANQLRLAGMQVETLSVSFGTVLLPVATQALGGIIAATKQLTQEFETGGLKESIAAVGQGFAEIAVSLSEGLVTAIPAVVEALKLVVDNMGLIVDLTKLYVTLWAGAKIAAVIASVVTALTAAGSATAILTTATHALNTAWLANPIGLVTRLLVVLGTAIVTAWHTSEDFRNATFAIWEGIKKAYYAGVNTIITLMNGLIAAYNGVLKAANYFGANFELVGKIDDAGLPAATDGVLALSDGMDAAKNRATALLAELEKVNKTPTGTAPVAGVSTPQASALGGGGKSARTTQLDQEAEAARRLTEEIQRAQMTDAAYSQWKISQEVSKLTAEYPNLTAKVKEWEQAQLQALRTGLVEDMQQTVNNIKQFNAELANVATGSQEELKLKKDVDAAWLKLQAFKTDLANIDTQINQAGGIIPQLDPELIRAQHAGSAYQIGANISEDVGTGVSDSWGNIGSGISSALSSALKGEKSWGDAFADLGINLMEGLVGGLWDSAQGILTDALKSIGGYIVKAFSGFMGIASPSKVFAELGYWTMAGYAEGLADSASMAMKPLSGLKSSMTGALSGVDMGALKASMMPSAGFALAGAGAGGGVAVNIVNKTSAQITDTQTSVSYDNNGNMQLDVMVADAAVSKITQTGSRQERAISRKFGMKSQPIKR